MRHQIHPGRARLLADEVRKSYSRSAAFSMSNSSGVLVAEVPNVEAA
jgi:hypothetical protein